MCRHNIRCLVGAGRSSTGSMRRTRFTARAQPSSTRQRTANAACVASAESTAAALVARAVARGTQRHGTASHRPHWGGHRCGPRAGRAGTHRAVCIAQVFGPPSYCSHFEPAMMIHRRWSDLRRADAQARQRLRVQSHALTLMLHEADSDECAPPSALRPPPCAVRARLRAEGAMRVRPYRYANRA